MPGPGGPATEFPSCGTPPYSIGVKVYPPRRAVKRTRASITAAWPCRGRCVSRSILDSISASEGKQVKGNASGFGRRSLLAGMTGAAALSGAAPAATANRIVDENRQSGTTDWQLQHYRLDSGAGSGLRSPMLEGYVSDVSAYPGEPIDREFRRRRCAHQQVDRLPRISAHVRHIAFEHRRAQPGTGPAVRSEERRVGK